MDLPKIEDHAHRARTYAVYNRNASALPIRIPVIDFIESGSQRQARNRNRGVVVRDFKTFGDCPDSPFHDHLCKIWALARHGHHPRDYSTFPVRHRFMDLYDQSLHRPVAGMLYSVRDHADALEALYFYYDVSQARRSLGTMAILSLLDLARDAGYTYVDLGQWSPSPARTAYKTHFRPYELLHDQRWVRYDA